MYSYWLPVTCELAPRYSAVCSRQLSSQRMVALMPMTVAQAISLMPPYSVGLVARAPQPLYERAKSADGLE